MKLLSLSLVWLVLVSTGQAQVKLISPEKEQGLKQFIPPTDNAHINTVVKSPNLIIYTDSEMPPAYQLDSGGYTSFLDVNYNNSGDPPDNHMPHGAGGNANVDFPWKKPGGTDACPGVETFKFIYLPAPIVYFHQKLPYYDTQDHHIGEYTRGLVWCFPKGTVIGEVLILKGEDGFQYTFEMRIREKADGFWDVDIFRPFPTAKDLLKVLKPNDAVAEYLRNSKPSTKRLVDSFHRQHISFDVKAGIDELPALTTVKASELLKQPFKSAQGKVWRDNCFSPTTKAAHHFIPKNYQGTFLGTDAQSCLKCHESTLQHVNYFQVPRGWYGYVRGSDQVLSFNIIEPSCIVHNGGSGPTILRKKLIAGGLLIKFDPATHKDYKMSK